MIRPPPQSPLFPYTTLFRSGLIRGGWDGALRRPLLAVACADGAARRPYPFHAWSSCAFPCVICHLSFEIRHSKFPPRLPAATRSEEHTSELQSQSNLVCRLL